MKALSLLRTAALSALLMGSLTIFATAQPRLTSLNQELARAGSTTEARSTAPTKAFNFTTKTAEWKANFAKHYTEMLRSRNASVRTVILQNIIHLANLQEDKSDFYPLVPALLNVYERDDLEARRVMALAALHAIGKEASMEYLRERLANEYESSKLVRRHTLAALYDFDQQQEAAKK